MERSRPAPGRLVMALDVAAALAGGLAGTIAVTGGIDLAIAGLRIGLHAWTRAAAVAVALIVARLWHAKATSGSGARRGQVDAIACVALAATALTSVGYWLVLLTTTLGGADSYGYVSASRLLLDGRLTQPQPMAAWLPVPDPMAVSAPAGYVPAAGANGIAPSYPLGLPALMALATLAFGAIGPYLVTPICGVVCLVLVWRLGTTWYGPLAGWLAAALVAWEPLVVTYAKQPMSDLPAAMWALLAVWWLERPVARPFASGVAAGLSFMTRPGGLGALVVIGLAALAGREERWPRLWRFLAGAVPLAALQAWLQWYLYGSPLRSGHGSVATLFAGGSVLANLGIYVDAVWQSHSWIWFVGLAAALAMVRSATSAGRSTPSRPLVLAVTMLVMSAIPYLLYWRFDHWETLRFLLPAIVLLSVVAAGGLVAVTSTRWPLAGPIVAVAAALGVAATSERFLRVQGVPGLREAEARYPRVAARIAATTPDTAVVLAMQHSGSIRHYAGRQTLRWDLLDAGELDAAVAALTARGHAVYVALEGDEQWQFDERFSAALTRVRRLPAGQVGIVQIWQLDVPASNR